MGNRKSILVGADVQAAAGLAAECVSQALSVGERPKTVALAGGATPVTLYTALTHPLYRDQIAWHRIEWFWSDERTVPPDHPDSNYRMANESLLCPLGITQERIHRMPADAGDLSQAARDYEHLIRRLIPASDSGIPVFDLVLLGVGTDGHIASLFPGSAALVEQDRLVVAHEIPGTVIWRMTMTFTLLRAARRILFFVTGTAKSQVLSRIFSPDADPAELPAAGLRRAAGLVTWVFDADAARLVPYHRPA